MYSKEQAEKWQENYHDVINGLISVHLETTRIGMDSEVESAKEHLVHGVSRRLLVIRTTLENIFSLFPLDSTKPLGKEILTNCEINLHAFVINLSGIFDNWAWAYVFRHNLLEELGSRRNVGLFNKQTQKYLPKEISDHLKKDEMIDWHSKYLKGFRDSLAHRIPLYIPPAHLTNEEATRFNEIESEKIPCILSQEWDKLESIEKEQKSLGKPFFSFMESFNDAGATRPVYMHPQLLSDGMAITEFGHLFVKHWHKRA